MRVHQTWIPAFLLSHAISNIAQHVEWDGEDLNIHPDRYGNVKFAVLADFGHVETSPHAQKMAHKLNTLCTNNDIHFIVSTGDNFYGTVDFQKYWIDRFNIGLTSCKWVVLAGNSDYKDILSDYHHALGKIEAQMEGPQGEFGDKWLMPRHNFIGIINGTDYEFAFLDTVEDSEQTKRIIKQRENLLVNMNQAKKYIVFGHYPILSNIQGDLGKKVTYLKNHFDKNKNILLYCASHVHALELLQYHDRTQSPPVPSYVQVISGAAGAFLNQKANDKDYRVMEDGLEIGKPIHSEIKKWKEGSYEDNYALKNALEVLDVKRGGEMENGLVNALKSLSSETQHPRHVSETPAESKQKERRGKVHYGESRNGFVVFTLQTQMHMLHLTYYTQDGISDMKTKEFQLYLDPTSGRVHMPG
uniref:AlNc14C264G9852 protein n=1 Tax=Albugo laibachii Nc14 TaxID=890382 RepID=F0WU29_9STRA|nr:AlNc14C264G9852 [Albugo laibachii Nc14]|eukprot:CCA24874.1 AlNc14C264G9852 [Albugo laibachii Nc14]